MLLHVHVQKKWAKWYFFQVLIFILYWKVYLPTGSYVSTLVELHVQGTGGVTCTGHWWSYMYRALVELHVQGTGGVTCTGHWWSYMYRTLVELHVQDTGGVTCTGHWWSYMYRTLVELHVQDTGGVTCTGHWWSYMYRALVELHVQGTALFTTHTLNFMQALPFLSLSWKCSTGAISYVHYACLVCWKFLIESRSYFTQLLYSKEN